MLCLNRGLLRCMRTIRNEYKSKMFNCRHPARVKLKPLNSQEKISSLNGIVVLSKHVDLNIKIVQAHRLDRSFESAP